MGLGGLGRACCFFVVLGCYLVVMCGLGCLVACLVGVRLLLALLSRSCWVFVGVLWFYGWFDCVLRFVCGFYLGLIGCCFFLFIYILDMFALLLCIYVDLGWVVIWVIELGYV